MWGNTYKSSLQPLFQLQKCAISNIHKVGYCDHTNSTLHFFDLVYFYTAQLLYKANKNALPENIQRLFKDREGGYHLKGCSNFKVHAVRPTKKNVCICVWGQTLERVGGGAQTMHKHQNIQGQIKTQVISKI